MDKEIVRLTFYILVAFFVVAAILFIFYMYADKIVRISVG